MIIARKSTAKTIIVGPVLDASGVAVTTAVVGDFKISKNGAAPAALNGSATLTHRHTGHYSLALTTSDIDTTGMAAITIDATTNACPQEKIVVWETAVYDVFFGTTAPSTYAGADTAGTTTLLSRIASTLTITAGAVTVGTNNDKTGYSLTQTFPTNFASLLINASGHISRVTLADALTANNDKTGYSLTQSFPTNFASLGINASGHISRVTLTDTVTTLTNLPTAPTDWITAAAVSAAAVTKIQNGLAGAAGITDIQSRLPAALVSGRMDSSVGAYQTGMTPLQPTVAGRTLAVDSGHAASADVNFWLGIGVESDANDRPVIGNVLGKVLGSAAESITGVGVWAADVSDIKVVTDKVNGMLVLDGSVYQYTVNALENAPAGGGGGGGTDWTTDERTAIRSILGIPTSGVTPETPIIGVLSDTADAVAALPGDVWSFATRTLTSAVPVPPSPPPPYSPSDMAANIKIALQQTMNSILIATASPKPSYTIEGQTVSYGDFIKMLIDSLTQLTTLLLSYEPFELHSVIDA